MSRRAAAPHRTILPDPKFGNDMLAKFINMVMERGKKSAAEKIVYGAIDRISEKKSGAAGVEAIAVLQQALDNVKPVVEVKSRRVGGAPIRCPSKFAPTAVRPWRCAGSSRPPRPAAKNPWPIAWPRN
jgi:small subunit ribosomal protein S7